MIISQLNPSVPLSAQRTGLAQTRGSLRFTILDDPLAALPLWRDLEHKTQGSIYQSADWLLPWLQTLGAETGIKPFLVLAFLPDGELGALFPFGLAEKYGLRLISFLGGFDSNAQMGLIRDDLVFDRSDMEQLRDHCASSSLRPDALILIHQPLHWQGRANPMALVAHQPSASAAFSTALRAPSEAFIAERLSKEHWKKLQKKKRKLHALGKVTYQLAQTPDQIRAGLEALFAQKLARLHQKHIATHLSQQAAKDFLNQCCLAERDQGNPVIELHVLKLNDKIISVFAGSAYQNCFYAMLNSFDTDPDIAKTSPGEVLLVEMIKGLSARGMTKLDLGIGEARYKAIWCKTTDPRFDTLIGLSLTGHLVMAMLKAKLHLKRWIKQTPWAWRLAQLMRPYSA
ncbi:MAG: GNAT family N-acetyltransferase [Alphaproteobacteria bacterium]|nr:GNAT family N-acetyltransferase [Alphaproteobacteria bacterium]